MVKGTASTRERILDAAFALFNAQGVRAVGVDAIVERAGVAKMSLYNHFSGKDELVEACVVRAGEAWRRWLAETVEKLSLEPAGRPLAVFDALEEWFSSRDFRGCTAINMTLELTEPEHPARRAAFAHKRLVREYLMGLCLGAGVRDASATADELMLLVEGAIVSAVMWNAPQAAARAKAAAGKILEGVKPVGVDGINM